MGVGRPFAFAGGCKRGLNQRQVEAAVESAEQARN